MTLSAGSSFSPPTNSSRRRGRAVEDRDGKAVVGHVENKILAHDGQADESDIMLHEPLSDDLCKRV